jgi:hypothetical protein
MVRTLTREQATELSKAFFPHFIDRITEPFAVTVRLHRVKELRHALFEFCASSTQCCILLATGTPVGMAVKFSEPQEQFWYSPDQLPDPEECGRLLK